MTSPKQVLRNAGLVLPERTVEGDLIVQSGRVQSLAPSGRGEGQEIWDLAGRTVIPGLIDTHTHGGWGIDFARDAAEKISGCAPRYGQVGVTRLLVTLLPGPEAEMLDSIANAAAACRLAPSALVGIHLEGPFLALDRRGALPEAGILPYDDGLMSRIIEAASGELRVMTIAPEAVPVEAIARIQSTGIRLSIGHTSADAPTTQAAIDGGVRRATHLCNAMPPLHHRSPGPLTTLLLDDRVRVEVIVDGEHVDDRVLQLILRTKGDRRVLAVSDSMPLAGLGAGEGEFAGASVLSDGSRATLADGTLAGSVTHLHPALCRLRRTLSLSPQQVASLGSTVPAEDLPRSGLGRIATGAPADLVILGEDSQVVATLRGGKRADDESASAWLPQEVERVR